MKPFLDEIEIRIRSGNGGDGIVSFRREKFVPKGGPDGGDGGNGGDVIFYASPHINTLSHLKPNKLYKAKDGHNGKGAKQSGKKGKDLIIELPVGSIIYDEDGNKLYDFTKIEEKFVILKGGRGGKGNQHFATSINQTPQIATKGKPGKEMKVKISLKIIADIGIVGFPNAGKSTFLKATTNANPKIASYPFTTLNPNLGTFSYDGKKYYVIADIPGIINGAHNGKGLGIKFLKHIERTRVLLILLDGEKGDYFEQYQALINELESFSKDTSVTFKYIWQILINFC
jgi:GTP-binding protein